ncbi:MAG TPA: 30S ribosomal protein S8 [Thermomicrobiales bacterium]|nr:30S ribosomal protein S8 [Thermomicrobiales bacterium]
MPFIADPISDMLTRIRNAQAARKPDATMPSTKMLVSIARVLQAEGYVTGYEVREGKPYSTLVVHLKYTHDKRPAIREIKRVSKSGLRIYRGKDALPRVKNGLGIAIITTSQGVMTGYEARRRNIGGEVICTVY